MSNSEKIILDDCIIIGNAEPSEISDNRITVCAAGYSEKLGLIRIYPVPPKVKIHRWNILQIPVEKDSRDNRNESWKVQGSKEEYATLHKKIRLIDKIERKEDKKNLINKLFSSYGVNCIEELNKQKRSLGFVKPKIQGYELEKRKEYDPSVQLRLDSMDKFLTIKNYPYIPKIKYTCTQCQFINPHNQQVLEWGIYEWMRKNPNNKNEAWKILGINDPLEKSIVSWLGISFFIEILS